MTTFKVTVELTGPEIWKLSNIAEQLGLTAGEYLARVIRDQRPSLDGSGSVVRMHAAGLTDQEISVALNMTRLAVATHRRKFHLLANRPTKKDHAA